MQTLTRTLSLDDCVNDLCPVTGRPVSVDALALYKGRVIGFASPSERDRFLGAYIAIEAALQGEVELAAARERELTMAQAMELARSARTQRWIEERSRTRLILESLHHDGSRPEAQRAAFADKSGHSGHVHLMPVELTGTCH